MQWDDIAGAWGDFKEPILGRWVRLTELEVDQMNGSRSALAERIAERYDVDVDTATAEVEEWLKRLELETPP